MRKIIICFLFIVSSLFSQESKLYISNIYATSTNLPLENNSVFNCFDSSFNTFWKTIEGSCQEEGIMIKLNKPSFIHRIEVLGHNGIEVENYDIYVDGSGYGSYTIDEKILNIFIKAKALCDSKHFSISEINFYKSSNQLYKVLLPEKVAANIKATSELKPNVAYGAINLIDGQKENAWAEGVTTSGIGEEINFKLERKIGITDLLFWNGYHRSSQHFTSNARAKKVLIKDINSGYSEEHELVDKMQTQKISLKSPLFTDELSIKILEVHEGTKYKDLVISEIQFMNNEKFYTLQSKELTKRIEDNILRSERNNILSNILDRNISYNNNSQEKEGQFIKYINDSRSILLRSNNTFVWYQNELENIVDTKDEEDEMGTNISKQIIADGSWYITEESSTYLKIKIFGKIFEPRDSSDLYKGNVTNQTLRIFHDYLTISKDEIIGEHIFETIPFNQ